MTVTLQITINKPVAAKLELPFNKHQTMADAAPAPTRGGFGGRGRGGDRGRGGRGRGRRGPKRDEEKEWVPVTKLGRLVRAGKIKSMEVSFERERGY